MHCAIAILCSKAIRISELSIWGCDSLKPQKTCVLKRLECIDIDVLLHFAFYYGPPPTEPLYYILHNNCLRTESKLFVYWWNDYWENSPCFFSLKAIKREKKENRKMQYFHFLKIARLNAYYKETYNYTVSNTWRSWLKWVRINPFITTFVQRWFNV